MTDKIPFKGVILGDVVQVLNLKSQSLDKAFDVIIADPPYNIGKDFGNDSDKQESDAYLRWTDEWIDLCLKTLTDNGVMYIYGVSEILARIASRYPIGQQRWLVWHYSNKATPSSRFWQRSHESILCLWNGSRPNLRIDDIREPYTVAYTKSAGKTRVGTNSRFGSGKETVYAAHAKGALPRDVIKAPALAGGAGAKERWFMCLDCGGSVMHPRELKKHRGHNLWKHPTQKPMAVTKRLMLSAAQPNSDSRVFIPFAGSGSECVVAQELGLDYFAVELNPDYVNFANKWLVAEGQNDDT